MIDTDKYEGHTPAPWICTHSPVNGGGQFWSVVDHTQPTDWAVGDDTNRRIADIIDFEADAQLIADAPLLLAEVKRLRHLCDTLLIYAHNIETGQSTIEKSNGEPLSTIDFEKDMTWLVTECKAGHLVGETGYEDCPDCGGEEE